MTTSVSDIIQPFVSSYQTKSSDINSIGKSDIVKNFTEKQNINKNNNIPRLTLFNKTYGTSDATQSIRSRNSIANDNDDDESTISYVKPKQSTSAGPTIKRPVEKSKLALMLSCLSGEIDDEDDIDSGTVVLPSDKTAAVKTTDPEGCVAENPKPINSMTPIIPIVAAPASTAVTTNITTPIVAATAVDKALDANKISEVIVSSSPTQLIQPLLQTIKPAQTEQRKGGFSFPMKTPVTSTSNIIEGTFEKPSSIKNASAVDSLNGVSSLATTTATNKTTFSFETAKQTPKSDAIIIPALSPGKPTFSFGKLPTTVSPDNTIAGNSLPLPSGKLPATFNVGGSSQQTPSLPINSTPAIDNPGISEKCKFAVSTNSQISTGTSFIQPNTTISVVKSSNSIFNLEESILKTQSAKNSTMLPTVSATSLTSDFNTMPSATFGFGGNSVSKTDSIPTVTTKPTTNSGSTPNVTFGIQSIIAPSFGNINANQPVVSQPPSFGLTAAKSAQISFGAQSMLNSQNPLFGNPTISSTETVFGLNAKSHNNTGLLFGSKTTSETQPTNTISIFGASTNSGKSTPNFGNQLTLNPGSNLTVDATNAKPSISSGMFGESTQSVPAFQLGSTPTTVSQPSAIFGGSAINGTTFGNSVFSSATASGSAFTSTSGLTFSPSTTSTFAGVSSGATFNSTAPSPTFGRTSATAAFGANTAAFGATNAVFGATNAAFGASTTVSTSVPGASVFATSSNVSKSPDVSAIGSTFSPTTSASIFAPSTGAASTFSLSNNKPSASAAPFSFGGNSSTNNSIFNQQQQAKSMSNDTAFSFAPQNQEPKSISFMSPTTTPSVDNSNTAKILPSFNTISSPTFGTTSITAQSNTKQNTFSFGNSSNTVTPVGSSSSNFTFGANAPTQSSIPATNLFGAPVAATTSAPFAFGNNGSVPDANNAFNFSAQGQQPQNLFNAGPSTKGRAIRQATRRINK